jgi:pimeloyl-ACP methyl ester carboxylesterase
MTAYVLVHGAFRGGWAWDAPPGDAHGGVRARLEAAGHRVLAPSLPQAGERYDGTDPLVTLPDYVADLVAAIEAADLREVVLVGHSQGGVVAIAVAAAVPDRVARLVLLDAPVPDPGTSVAEVVPVEVRAAYGDPPPPSTWLPARPLDVDDGLGLTPPLVAWANALLTPSPAGPAYDPVPALPSGIAVRQVFFARTPAWFPCIHTRARLDAQGTAYELLDAGHDAPLTHPAEVAALLLRA